MENRALLLPRGGGPRRFLHRPDGDVAGARTMDSKYRELRPDDTEIIGDAPTIRTNRGNLAADSHTCQ